MTTTLFARLILADLFIHGIGGAKYDELNDEIIRRFYGFEPPAYLVLSATLLLPFQLPSVRLEDTRRLAGEIRDVRCNPQRHLADGALVDTRPKQLAAEKREWIERQPEDAPSRRARFHRLKSLTEELGAFTAAPSALASNQFVRMRKTPEEESSLEPPRLRILSVSGGPPPRRSAPSFWKSKRVQRTTSWTRSYLASPASRMDEGGIEPLLNAIFKHDPRFNRRAPLARGCVRGRRRPGRVG